MADATASAPNTTAPNTSAPDVAVDTSASDGSLDPELVKMAIEYGSSALLAIIVLFAGWMLSRWLGAFVAKRMEKLTKGDVTLAAIFGKVVRMSGMVLTGLVVLSQFGVQTTTLVALLGAAGLTIGLALQGTLANVAAGVMLLIFRPFKLGDVIEVSGVVGKVRDIGLFITQLDTPDNIRVYLPNSGVWGNQIKNLVENPTRRLDLVFSISYKDDMDQALAIAKEIVEADPRVQKDPAPLYVVGQLGDSSVDLFIRPWVTPADLWPLRFALIQNIKKAFDERGITIPYPQRDVHMFQHDAATAKT